MDLDLSDISVDNIGAWPMPVKMAVITAILFLLLGLGYWFDTQDQLQELSGADQKEIDLRQQFEDKQQRAANLPAYKEQLAAMKTSFGAMLRQLPVSTEVPGLLEDISKAGLASGLEFRLFKPLPEKQFGFYAELPIEISVIGSYHQLAQFASKISALDRIVTLHDFTIELDNKNDATGVASIERLVMDITAMTYRYTEEHKKSEKKTTDGKNG